MCPLPAVILAGRGLMAPGAGARWLLSSRTDRACTAGHQRDAPAASAPHTTFPANPQSPPWSAPDFYQSGTARHTPSLAESPACRGGEGDLGIDDPHGHAAKSRQVRAVVVPPQDGSFGACHLRA